MDNFKTRQKTIAKIDDFLQNILEAKGEDLAQRIDSVKDSLDPKLAQKLHFLASIKDLKELDDAQSDKYRFYTKEAYSRFKLHNKIPRKNSYFKWFFGFVLLVSIVCYTLRTSLCKESYEFITNPKSFLQKTINKLPDSKKFKEYIPKLD